MWKDWCEKIILFSEAVWHVFRTAGVVVVVIFVLWNWKQLEIVVEFPGLFAARVVNDPERLVGQTDTEATGASKQIASLIDTKASSFWVYLGATESRQKTAWITGTNNFELKEVPKKSDVIVATLDVYKRASMPVRETQGWVMGNIIGVLEKEQSVTVQDVVEIPGAGGESLWWAKIRLL